MAAEETSLREQIDPERIPRHTAIIMDGNGRWAAKRGLLRKEGHRAGVRAAGNVLRAAAECGVRYLTLYTFSKENWHRPKEEVDALMDLLVRAVAEELPTLEKNKVRILTIGDIEELPKDAQEAVVDLVEGTKDFDRITLVLAINYSGRAEMTRMINRLREEPGDHTRPLTEEDIRRHLYLPDLPDPDLLIRTGGECRISNFLLWQLAYTELYFTDTYWPDFGSEDLYRAFIDYQSRQRRFGRTGDQVTQADYSSSTDTGAALYHES